MKNYEKYAEEIKKFNSEEKFCNNFVMPHVLNSSNCNEVATCGICRVRQMIWLMEEYKEPKTDWSKVKVDTPILVKDNENTVWVRRHFAKYENGDIWAWRDSRTSWTVSNDDDMTWWRYAKLAESEEE